MKQMTVELLTGMAALVISTVFILFTTVHILSKLSSGAA